MEKRYNIVYADPPWELKAGPRSLHDKNEKSRALVYPTMSLDAIKALPVPATDNAVLFLWTINKYIEASYAVARAWGFEPSTMLVWCKKPKGRGLGGTFGISTEYLLFARRGSYPAKDRHWSTWFEATRREHSRKPEIARQLIEKCFDGTKLELFAREKAPGWDVWGNEVESDVDFTSREVASTGR